MITAEYLEEQEYKRYIDFYNYIKNKPTEFVENVYWKGIKYLESPNRYINKMDVEICVRICEKILDERWRLENG